MYEFHQQNKMKSKKMYFTLKDTFLGFKDCRLYEKD